MKPLSIPERNEYGGRKVSEPVTFTVAGEPVGKAARATSKGFSFTPAKTRAYMDAIRFYAQQAMAGNAPFTVPLRVDLLAVFSVPASWSKKKQTAALLGEIKPGKKPDLNNIQKGIEDACNQVVWADDALIVEYTTCRKVYGPAPMVVVTVRPA